MLVLVSAPGSGRLMSAPVSVVLLALHSPRVRLVLWLTVTGSSVYYCCGLATACGTPCVDPGALCASHLLALCMFVGVVHAMAAMAQVRTAQVYRCWVLFGAAAPAGSRDW